MRRPAFKVSRDLILFVVGLAGIVYVTLTGGTDRPTLLVLFAGMIGLPMFLRSDEQRPDPPPPSEPAPLPGPEPASGEHP